MKAADVSSFRSTFGLSGGAFNLIKNGTDPGLLYGQHWTLHALTIRLRTHLMWSGQERPRPKATVDLVVTQQTNTNDAIYESANYVITNNTAKILNVSYGQLRALHGHELETQLTTICGRLRQRRALRCSWRRETQVRRHAIRGRPPKDPMGRSLDWR